MCQKQQQFHLLWIHSDFNSPCTKEGHVPLNPEWKAIILLVC